LAGDSKRISVVGDDQQTIYSWRGSNFEIFLNFEKDWPESKVVVLDQNYRSSGNIIAAASAVISNNTKQKPKKLWTEQEAGLPVKILEVSGEDDEALWVAERIRRTGTRSTAILYRTNAQSRPIEQALIERSIPYRVYGGLRFYERREIKDIVAALRYASNPEDSVSAERLLKTFRKTKFAALQSLLKTRADAAPFELIPLIIKETGYLEYLEKNFTNSLERRENLGELMHFAAQFEDLGEFLERITLLQATDSVADDGAVPPVNLMTMHLAKGLEFDRVFVVGAVEGILPHARSMESQAEVEEERRLMYVGMTRAREELIISFYDLPSRFLSEIPQEHVAFESTVSDDRFFVDNEDRWISWD
jgi:DNA helicase II / ATP-dependent DNA helicase PcrA